MSPTGGFGSRQLVRACGLFMLVPVLIWRVLHGSGVDVGLRLGATALGCVAFGVAFWITTSMTPPRRAVVVALLLVQTAIALGFLATGGEFEAMMLSVIAGQLGILLPVGTSAVWIVAQTAAMGLATSGTLPPERLAAYLAGHLLFQGFALAAGLLLRDVDATRMELEEVNAELLATRELLADRSRSLERVRISRDLHDGVGGGVTALILALESAKRAPPEEMRPKVESAQQLSRRLLDEVREAVRQLRQAPPDVERALRSLVADIEHPRVHLELAPDLPAVSPEAFHALFRSAQEAITNTLRHAGAENLWISCRRDGDRIELSARDDGRGLRGAPAGHGLTGMRERVEELGGELTVSRLEGGTRLRVVLPAGKVAA